MEVDFIGNTAQDQNRGRELSLEPDPSRNELHESACWSVTRDYSRRQPRCDVLGLSENAGDAPKMLGLTLPQSLAPRGICFSDQPAAGPREVLMPGGSKSVVSEGGEAVLWRI